MRLLKYLEYSSGDEKVKKVRSFKFNLVKENTGYEDDVREYLPDALILRDRLNKELKRIYRGSYRFDFCIGEGMKPSEIKIKQDKENRLKEKWFEFNDKLGIIQKKFEESLKDIDNQE